MAFDVEAVYKEYQAAVRSGNVNKMNEVLESLSEAKFGLLRNYIKTVNAKAAIENIKNK
ncbi:MAG: hypothetical protein LBO08_00285 [Rickettsiales bacterium]|jgi:cytochrome c553|nr:hypothetical protein [Rickettsiales bacterium]